MDKLSLFLCCLRDGENNLNSTPFKIYRPTEFNKKCVGTKETAARNLCNERLGVLCQGLPLNCFSKHFVMKACTKEVGECQKVSFVRSQIKPCLFSKYSVKTRW